MESFFNTGILQRIKNTIIISSKWSNIFFFLIIADVVYTFLQCYFSMNLDGDMCSIIVPSEAYKKILSDPFGFSVIFNNDYYAATNRFFIHWFMRSYFRIVPFFFQLFTDPIESIYLSLALARTVIQAAIIYLFANIISNSSNIFNKKFLAAAILIIPFFQIGGYNQVMGITYNSITYTFFYSLPFLFLLLYFLPFFKFLYHKKEIKLSFFYHVLLLADALIISFGGPLGSSIILIVCPFLLIYLITGNFKQIHSRPFINRLKTAIFDVPKSLLFHFVIISLLGIYSIYLGTHNTENEWFTIPISERYKLLPQGFWNLISLKLGLPLLLGLCLLNSILLLKIYSTISKRILKLSYFIGIICLFYLLLLPLGGYRTYRPFIIRSDTFSPITISLIFYYGLSSCFLINQLRGKTKTIFISLSIITFIIFMNADRIDFKGNECEKNNLKAIRSSPEPIVQLIDKCNVMSWTPFLDYKESSLNAELFRYWNVTGEKKYYFSR